MIKISGGCYSGAIKYKPLGDIQATIKCHCRECQYNT